MIKKDIAFEKENLKPYEKFNRYNLYVFILIMLLPLIYKILKKKYTYLELFDKLSIPILIALYSYFWLKFTNTIEKLKRLIISKTNKTEDIKKHIQLFSIDELKRNENEVNELDISLRNNILHLDFVNKSLRCFAVAVVIVKIVSFIFENVCCYQ